ncbi:Transcriptional activator of fatty acid utilization [Aspergillus hancockii]|nr:Transcriptional activator of fatty acid utilization [Aspergillus hancockii]
MDVTGAYKSNLNLLDDDEIKILLLRGAFEVPAQHIQDKLITAFFAWVAPVLPVVNERAFLSMHTNPLNPPPLLLLQAIFLAGSRVFEKGKSSEGESHSGVPSSIVFLQRAKALYDAGFEKDTVTVVQSLVLMSWYWYGTEDITENGLFYWSRLAIGAAQNIGMHRSDELELCQPERRLWRRIWWTLYTRDRAIAAAYGRPISIHMDHTNVGQIMPHDFVEDKGHQPDPVRVMFFLQYVKLCELMDLVVHRRTVTGPLTGIEYAQCEARLSRWLLQCPRQMQWSQSRHEFWSAILQSIFNTMVCQLHALQPAVARPSVSTAVALQAGSTIVSIMQAILSHDQVNFVPPSVMLTVLSAAKSPELPSSPTLVLQWRTNIEACLQILELVANTWPIAAMLREGAGLIYSGKYFDKLLNEALVALEDQDQTNEAQVGQYRRKRYNRPRRVNMDFLLPDSRIIVKISPGHPQIQSAHTSSQEANPGRPRRRTTHSQDSASSQVNSTPKTAEAYSAFPEPADVLQSLRVLIQLRQGMQEAELANVPSPFNGQ